MAYVSKNQIGHLSLNITEDEAVFLATVLRCVGGSRTDSPRKHQLAISDALYDYGIEYLADSTHSGGIVFKDTFKPGYYAQRNNKFIEKWPLVVNWFDSEPDDIENWTRITSLEFPEDD